MESLGKCWEEGVIAGSSPPTGLLLMLCADGVEIHEPALEQRPRHRLQRRVHPPVQLDLVVQRPSTAAMALRVLARGGIAGSEVFMKIEIRRGFTDIGGGCRILDNYLDLIGGDVSRTRNTRF